MAPFSPVSQTATGPRPSDRWIPWYFVGFFVILAALLGNFAWLALRDFPGTVSDKAYEQGLAYNATLQATAAQQALGWQGVMTVAPDGHNIKVNYHLQQSDGVMINNAVVTGWFYRPSSSKLDQKFSLQKLGNGDYQATLSLPVSGVWDVRLAAQAAGHEFQQTQRVILP
jgi:nitrogen fixation protein FixH